MTKIIPSVAITVYKNDKVLVVQHEKGSDTETGIFGLPAGIIQKNETPKQCAVRKLEDETGIKTEIKYLIKIPKKYRATIKRKDGTKTFSMQVFVAKKWNGRLSKGLNEIPKWIKISNLEKYKFLPNKIDAIKQGLKYK